MLKKAYRRLRKLQRDLEFRTLQFVSKRPRLAAVYFATFDASLSREAAGVAAGRARYERDLRGEAQSYYLLRRNIHRLEKGLIMRPRRTIFAVDYLEETVSIFVHALKFSTMLNDEHLWAKDVLAAYFAAVDQTHPVIAKQKERFGQAVASLEPGEAIKSRTPYVRQREYAGVTYDAMKELAIRRRSVRWYEDKPVPREMLDKAFAVATQAPSACNRQPFHYYVIEDPERARKLAAIPQGTKGFAETLPSLIVLVGHLRAYPEARDRHAIYIDGGLSAMSLMFAFETLGLSSCPINFPDVREQEEAMARELGLDADDRVIMLIAYGYPDHQGMIPFSAKRQDAALRSYEGAVPA